MEIPPGNYENLNIFRVNEEIMQRARGDLVCAPCRGASNPAAIHG